MSRILTNIFLAFMAVFTVLGKYRNGLMKFKRTRYPVSFQGSREMARRMGQIKGGLI